MVGLGQVGRSKTFWTCLSVRLVFAARSNSSAILSAFLLFVSFVEIRRSDKASVDVAGQAGRKQGFDSPRLQVAQVVHY
jgi:hypothetical protein